MERACPEICAWLQGIAGLHWNGHLICGVGIALFVQEWFGFFFSLSNRNMLPVKIFLLSLFSAGNCFDQHCPIRSYVWRKDWWGT